MAQKIIVVGVDGSSASDAALRYAVHEAIATGARVCAVTAWWVGPALSDVHDELYEDRRQHAKTVQASAIESVVSSIDNPPEIDRRVLHGSPTATLLQASRGAQCLVVGSEHKGIFKRMTEGSVSVGCARHSTVPLIIVPWSKAELDDQNVFVNVGQSLSDEPTSPAARV